MFKQPNYVYDFIMFVTNDPLSVDAYLPILDPTQTRLLSLLDDAYQVRLQHFSKRVTLHIINNSQNGYCPEDCNYCAQSKSVDTDIERYGLKELDEMVNEADQAYEKGAYRYCMVLSGRGPTPTKINQLSSVIRTIKSKYPEKEICLSAGLINDSMAVALKSAGLDRLNHNLNSSEKNYEAICSTHTYQDRLQTLKSAQKAGLSLCSGLIVGLGETKAELIELALKFRELNIPSIPVNFLIPIPGTPFEHSKPLDPEFCLRVLCLFRFINPKAEIRIAGGREYNLRSLQVMGLYPANSIFMDGYLNVTGSNQIQTLEMIKDAGFDIDSTDIDVNTLLNQHKQNESSRSDVPLKDLADLRPTFT